MANLTQKSKEYAIKLFLRSIGVELAPVKLYQDLSSYIDKSYKHLGCCVLWYRSLNDNESELSELLQKHNIVPKYLKFSIILRGSSVLFAKDKGCIPVLLYQDSHRTYEKPKAVPYVNAYPY